MKLVSIAPRFVLCLSLITGPLMAEENNEGRSLMEEGAMLFLKGLQQQIEPSLEDLGALAESFGPALNSFVQEMGPALGDLMTEVEDWSVYYPPEILDNGDIVIRRKQPEAAPEQVPETDGEQIDL